MGRKCKTGLTYFSHDTNMSEDHKTELLISKYGVVGYGTYNMILERGYKEHGYYFMADEDSLVLLSAKLKLEVPIIQDIIEYSIKKNLFNEEMYQKYGILTCRRMQENYIRGSETRKFIEVDSRHLLVDIALVKTKKSAFDIIYTDLNEVKPVGKAIKPVGKYTKKRKGKEIKEDNTNNDIPDSVKIELQAIVDKWNIFAVTHKLQICQKLHEDRKYSLYQRYKEPEFDLDKILIEIKQSDFLLGKNKKSAFRVSFDWIIEDDKNYTKILEGKYRGNAAPEKPSIEDEAFRLLELRKSTLVKGYNACIRAREWNPVSELARGIISRLPDEKGYSFSSLKMKLERKIREYIRPHIKELEDVNKYSAVDLPTDFHEIELQIPETQKKK